MSLLIILYLENVSSPIPFEITPKLIISGDRYPPLDIGLPIEPLSVTTSTNFVPARFPRPSTPSQPEAHDKFYQSPSLIEGY